MIKLHGSLRRYRSASVTGAGHRPFTLVVAEGATVGTILQKLNIPEETVSAVALNGQQADKGTVLSDRDTVHLFPPAAGGRCSG